jgi:predicted TIM-barrel fold metal-dependent hydrolase
MKTSPSPLAPHPSVIDAHCHIGEGYAMTQTADELLRQMDECGVDKAVICPAEPQIAVYNREGNDLTIAATRQHPDRFIPFATCNPWYGSKAVEELRRCFAEGCSGLKLHPPLQGFSLGQEIVYPLIEACREVGAPIYVHTGTLICSEPFQLLELAWRFPEVDFIIGHLGATDYSLDVIPAAKKAANIYLENSARIGPPLSDAPGAARVVFGSDSPVWNMKVQLAAMLRARISEEVLAAMLGGNMQALLAKFRA